MSNMLSDVARNGDELADAIEQANFVHSAVLPDAARATVAVEIARISAEPAVAEAGEALIAACIALADRIAACGPMPDVATQDSIAPEREKAQRLLEGFLDLVHAAEPNELAALLQPEVQERSSVI